MHLSLAIYLPPLTKSSFIFSFIHIFSLFDWLLNVGLLAETLYSLEVGRAPGGANQLAPLSSRSRSSRSKSSSRRRRSHDERDHNALDHDGGGRKSVVPSRNGSRPGLPTTNLLSKWIASSPNQFRLIARPLDACCPGLARRLSFLNVFLPNFCASSQNFFPIHPKFATWQNLVTKIRGWEPWTLGARRGLSWTRKVSEGQRTSFFLRTWQ